MTGSAIEYTGQNVAIRDPNHTGMSRRRQQTRQLVGVVVGGLGGVVVGGLGGVVVGGWAALL